jgi:hypothetical protein
MIAIKVVPVVLATGFLLTYFSNFTEEAIIAAAILFG